MRKPGEKTRDIDGEDVILHMKEFTTVSALTHTAYTMRLTRSMP